MKHYTYRIYPIIFCLALLASLIACPLRAADTASATKSSATKDSADDVALPDSLITDDNVYEYTFSDFPLACRIMDELRLRKKLPPHRLDLLEGDLYYNGGYNYRALKSYRRAIESDSIRYNNEDYMDLLHRMITIYDALQNDQKRAQYVQLLMDKAQATGNKAMHAVALFNLGKMLYYQGNKPRGYEYIYRAIDEMKDTDYKYKYDNLRYHYNTLLIMQKWDKRYEDALKTMDDLEAIITREQGNEPHMEGLDEKEMKSLYANRANFLYRLGRKAEAKENYKKFQTLIKSNQRFNYLISPYLYDCGLYDEIISIRGKQEKFLIDQADTVNYLMATVKRSLARAYEGKGDFRRAAAYYEQLSILRDSIKNREQRSAALELAAVYETAEKDALVQQQASQLRERNILLASAAGIVLLLCIGLTIMVWHILIIQRKNKIMAHSISEKMDYKKQLHDTRNTIKELRKQIEDEQAEKEAEKNSTPPDKQQPETQQQPEMQLPDSNLQPEMQLPDAQQQPDSPAPITIPQEPNDPEPNDPEPDDEKTPINAWELAENRMIFERMETILAQKRPYLERNFNRMDLAVLAGVGRNRLNTIILQNKNISPALYINNLRLEHAAQLIKEHPEYIISRIAESSGMPNISTFHRLFRERYSMTPMEYKKALFSKT